jgi:N-acetylglucosaminyl-diphospho-decaprenol L-rhamnosyltransferase
MKVTFVTVCYRTPELIRSLLRGVEAARFAFPFEYILVNNAPGDGTRAMVEEHFPWVTYVDAPGNVGFGAGNNIAFRQAKGEYVMLVNPDLTVFPGEMEKLVAYADAHPEVGFVGPKLLNPNRSLQRTFTRLPGLMIPVYRRTPLGKSSFGKRAIAHFLMMEEDGSRELDVDVLFGAAILMRRRALDEIGHFDERFFMYFEDTDLCRRAWETGHKVRYAPVAEFVHYHQRESAVNKPWQAITNRVAREHIKSAVRYFMKYRGKPGPRQKG